MEHAKKKQQPKPNETERKTPDVQPFSQNSDVISHVKAVYPHLTDEEINGTGSGGGSIFSK